MPIVGLVDLQRRSAPLGEIRMGTSVAIEGKTYRKPVRLETWRFTTGSEHAAKVIAEMYGGEVAPWTQRKGKFEVITDRTALDVWVPPRGEAVDANMELWDGPRRLRKCDGITMSRPVRKPCMCPHPDDPDDPVSVDDARNERMRLAGLRPPQACKPLTRISVTIPDLPGLTGVWKLNTGSENAAVETADSGEAMEIARAGGVYLPAVLRIEWRTRSADGKPYPVPVLQIGLSMRQIAQAALPAGADGLLTQLRRAAPGPMAIESGQAPVAVPEPGPADEDQKRYELAQSIADECATAEVAPARFKQRWAEARQSGAVDEHICIDRANDEWELLSERLDYLWREKAKGAA